MKLQVSQVALLFITLVSSTVFAEDFDHSDHSDPDDHGDDHDDHDDHADELSVAAAREDVPWGPAIGAAILINLVTLVGVIFLVGACIQKKLQGDAAPASPAKGSLKWKFTHNIIPSFACGAILATAVFLIIPESLLMITEYIEANPEDFGALHEEEGEDDHDGHNHMRFLEEEEHEAHADIDVPVGWRFGTCILGGFLLPIVTGLIFPHYHEPEICEKCQNAMNDPAGVEFEGTVGEEIQEKAPPKTQESMTAQSEGNITAEGCEDAGCDHGEHQCLDHADSDLNSDLEAPQDKAAEVVVTPPQQDKPSEVKSRFAADPTSQVNWTLASSVLLGDFAHNFVDGVLVGTAFLLCDQQLAITISAATVYHELAQEVADYFLLTKHCNLTIFWALFLNFACGLSVLLGAVVVLSVEVTSLATGCLLAVGGGVYIYIAGGECLPRARHSHKNTQDKLVSLASFVFGVIPIGLVLLNHGHCEEDGAHNH
jgi:zinc transporter ZupT